MTEQSNEALESIEVVAYDPRWPDIFAAERKRLLVLQNHPFLTIEHIGSTAVPDLAAKPVIDMMAAVEQLADCDALLDDLARYGYRLVPTGMRNRLLFRAPAQAPASFFHLHIVEQNTWDERNERLMRDYLLAHPATAKAYGDLKEQLISRYRHDSLGYTRAKTDFIQTVIDQARSERGLPLVQVWED